MKMLFNLRDRLNQVPLSIVQLLMRIGVGAVFFRAGLLKAESWEMTVKLFQEEYRVPLLPPEIAARMAMAQELTLPIFLFLGLATRIATLPLFGMLFVIQTFVYPDAWGEHLVWGSMLLFLLLRGAGTFSVDHLLSRTLLRRSQS